MKTYGTFLALKEIDKGAFGTIYEGENQKTHQKIALKVEKKSSVSATKNIESNILKKLSNTYNFPKFYQSFSNGDENVIAMELLGPNLEKLFKICDYRFSLKTVLMLSTQMISIVEKLHNLSFIHRDLKPENFILGIKEKKNILNLIDFGLSMQYRDDVSHVHIPCLSSSGLIGTVRYASKYAHNQMDLSRRDDLISVAYILIYFLKGVLPWQSLSSPNNFNDSDNNNRFKNSNNNNINFNNFNNFNNINHNMNNINHNMNNINNLNNNICKTGLNFNYNKNYHCIGSPDLQNVSKKEMTGELKNNLLPSQLCQGLPEEFETFIKLLYELGFDEKPNYYLYKKLFFDLMMKKGYLFDFKYDWIEKVDEFGKEKTLPLLEKVSIDSNTNNNSSSTNNRNDNDEINCINMRESTPLSYSYIKKVRRIMSNTNQKLTKMPTSVMLQVHSDKFKKALIPSRLRKPKNY